MKKRIVVWILAAICLVACLAVAASADAPTAEVAGHNLALKDNVYIVYYVNFKNVSEGAEKGVLVWTDPQVSYTYGKQDAILPIDIPYKGYETYYFTGVSAKMMAQDIYAVPYVKEGETITYGDLDIYSVRKYADNKKGSGTMVAGGKMTLGDLLVKLLDYGAAAQKYHNYRIDQLANAGYNEVASVDPNAYSQGFEFVSRGDGTCILYDVGACSDKVVKIPPYSPSGEKVVAIGKTAFENAQTIVSVEIPEGVERIGNMAFSECCSLQSVTLPKSLVQIGNDSFACCNISSLTLPENLTSIGVDAFCENPITSLAIPTGITKIEDYTFSGCSSLKTVSLPATLKAIGEGAFSGCSNLTSINLPESLTDIGHSAFSYCSSLTSIQIPESVTSIEAYAFADCSNLTSINLPASLTSIENETFVGCSSLAAIELPAGVTSIGNSAFYNCSSLTSIAIPSGVTSIGNYVFCGCSSLPSIEIPASLTSIGESAFNGCLSLTSISIPAGVTSIEAYAFVGCSSLTSIEIPASVTSIGEGAFGGCSSLTSIEIPANVTSIGFRAFYNCSSLTSITISEGVTEIGIQAFGDCLALCVIENKSLSLINLDLRWVFSSYSGESIKTVYWLNPDGSAEQFTSWGYGEVYQAHFDSYLLTDDGLFFVENGQAYELYAYFGESGQVTLPESVNGKPYQIVSLTGVTELILPEGWTSIESKLFAGCTSLKTVTLPATLKTIGEKAFEGCYNLTSIEIPASVTSIGDSAFYECSNLASVTFAAGSQLKSIGERAFSGCSNLTSIEIPAGVTSIETQTFRQCSKLASVTFAAGSQLEYINYYAFEGCTSLAAIEIPASVTSIGDYAFSGCSSLTSITIPSGVTSIEYAAFYDCSSLTSITIPSGVTRIGESAFYGCSSLTSIEIPASVTEIGSEAFAYCKDLASVTVGKGSCLTNIGGKYAFRACTALATITLPQSLTSIGSWTFADCTNLSEIVFLGSAAGWENVDKGTGWDNNTGDYTLVFNTTLPSHDLAFASNGDGTCCVSGIGNYTGADLVIPLTSPEGDRVTGIKEGAFVGCRSLVSVAIPNSVTSIGDCAFAKCTNLKTITFLGSEKEWAAVEKEDDWDSECNYSLVIKPQSEGLEYTSNGDGTCYVSGIGECIDSKIVIPFISPLGEAVTAIGENAFVNQTQITDISIPDSVQVIGNKVFCNTGLTEITIPASVVSIGTKIFMGCDALETVYYNSCFAPEEGLTCLYTDSIKEVVFGDNITYLPDNICYGCSALEKVTLPSNLKEIGSRCFYQCTSLRSIEFPKTVTELGWYAFQESGLESVVIPDSVTKITNTFRDCRFDYVVLPKSIVAVTGQSFLGCSIQKVYYEGDEKNWSYINIDNSSAELEFALRYYYSDTNPSNEGLFWRYVKGKIVEWE